MLPMALNMPPISGAPDPEKMLPLAMSAPPRDAPPNDDGELPSQRG